MNVGPVIVARFGDRCGLCDEPIFEGDEIRLIDDEPCHASCAEDEMDARDANDDETL